MYRPKRHPRVRELLLLFALSLIVSCNTPGGVSGSPDPDETARTHRSGTQTSELPRARTVGELQVVATFTERRPTGVAVTDGGRTFLSFPRHDPGVPFTVAELEDGKLQPYPNRSTNRLKREAPTSHLLSVEGLVVGPSGDLWVLDTGRPDFDPTIAGGAKLVRIDLESNRVERTYVLPASVAGDEAFLADVRIDPRRGRHGHAFITDASPSGFNGLIVVDLTSGEAWRKLDLHPATRAESEFVGMIEGRPFLFDPPQRPASHISLGANGLAIGADGERLFFRVLAGRELYSVRTDALIDRDMPPPQVEDSLRRYGNLGFASDGLAADDEGRIYLTNYEDHAIMRRHPNGFLEAVLLDPRLLWPDSVTIADGFLYVTVNQTHREPIFNDGEDRSEPPFVLFRSPIEAEAVNLE